MSAKKPKVLVLADGRQGLRPFRTDVWMDLRASSPSPRHIAGPGFPKGEEGSIDRAARAIMKGHAARIACFDRVLGRYRWTVERGERVPGTHLYQTIAYKGGPENRPANHREPR